MGCSYRLYHLDHCNEGHVGVVVVVVGEELVRVVPMLEKDAAQLLDDLPSALQQRRHVDRDAVGRAVDEHFGAALGGGGRGGGDKSGGEGGGGCGDWRA